MAKRKAKKRKTARDRLREEREYRKELEYLADTLLRQIFKDEDDETIRAFLKAAGGVRARKMLRILKRLYKYPDKFGKKLRAALESTLFARKLEKREKEMRKRRKEGNNPNLMALSRRGRGRTKKVRRASELKKAV